MRNHLCDLNMYSRLDTQVLKGVIKPRLREAELGPQSRGHEAALEVWLDLGGSQCLSKTRLSRGSRQDRKM